MFPANLTGTVVYPSKEPATEAKVSVVHPESGRRWVTASGLNGHFQIEGLGIGRYLLSVEYLGFDAPVREISISSSDNELRETIELSFDKVRTEVIVSATALPMSGDAISRAIETIRQSDWQSRGVSTLSEALQQSPGLRVQTLGGPGGFTRLLVRGLRPQDSAITIDGFRFRDAATTQGDATPFIENMMLANSQRVEVLRGSGSALYGSNAVGGVINVVTEEATDRWRGSLSGEGGGLAYGRGLLQFGGPLTRNLFLSAGLQHTNVSAGNDGQDPFRNTSLQSGLLWRPSSTISLNARFFGADAFAGLNDSPFAGPTTVLPLRGVIRAIPITLGQQREVESGRPLQYTDGANFVPNLNDPDSHRASRFAANAFAFSQQLTPRLHYRINYQNVYTRRRFEDGPAGVRLEPAYRSEDRIRGQVDTIQGRADFSASAKWTIGGGYEFEREDFRSASSNAAPQPLKTLSLANQISNAILGYAEGRLWHDRLHVSLAGRIQRFGLRQPTFEGAASPYASVPFAHPPTARTFDAGLSWFLARTGTKLRAHAGNGYRSPSLYERFGSSFVNGTFSANGDPGIRPDRTISLDSGMDQYLWRERVRLSGTMFYTGLREVIVFDSSGFLNPAVDPFKRSTGYINTSGGIARGVESQAEMTLPRRIRWLTSYTFTNSSQRRSTVRDNDFFRSTMVVPHQFTNMLTVPITRQFDLTASSLITSSHAIVLSRRAFSFDGARRLDLVGAYRIPWERRSLKLQAKLSNVLDARYLENGFRAPGFWATAGFTIAF